MQTFGIPFLKKGGIHIKKKNKGLFTKYCNGKVTEECIAVIDRSIIVAEIAVLRRERLIVIFAVKHFIRVTSGLIPHDDRRHHAK